MARPATNLPEWATDAAFPAGSDPWSGQPPRVAAAMAALAATGHIPNTQTDAEPYNAWIGLLSEWITHFRLETGAVSTGYSLAASEATDSVLFDALELKGNLAGGNVWTGSQEFDGGINVDGASTVDAEMVFTARPAIPQFDADIFGLNYTGVAGARAFEFIPFYLEDVEAGGGSGPTTMVEINADLVESIGIAEIRFIAWNDGAATASMYENNILFNSPIGATPTYTENQRVTLLGGGITGLSALLLNPTTNSLRYTFTTSANGTRHFAGWYKVLRADRTQ